jgi:hypothetical protein
MITARGEAHIVARKESVCVKFPNGEIQRINNVLNVPNIKWVLLSIGCIFDQRYIVKFMNSICIIRDMQIHTIVGKGHKLEKRGLYKLQVKSIANVENCNVEQLQNVGNFLFWHKKLRHISFRTLY